VISRREQSSTASLVAAHDRLHYGELERPHSRVFLHPSLFVSNKTNTSNSDDNTDSDSDSGSAILANPTSKAGSIRNNKHEIRENTSGNLQSLSWVEAVPILNALSKDPSELALTIEDLSKKNRLTAMKKLRTTGQTEVLSMLSWGFIFKDKN
jgi:hypothetical protein